MASKVKNQAQSHKNLHDFDSTERYQNLQAEQIQSQRKQQGVIVSNKYSSMQHLPKQNLRSASSSSLTILPNHEPTRCSFKNNGVVKGYAANTNQGLVRNYNEDRVAIILNILKPQSRQNEIWPKCSYFGVYDGHGGVQCADFLRDNLHQFVIKEPTFPSNPKEALLQGFMKAEQKFLEQAAKLTDRSGSCAIIVLIVGKVSDVCYVANVGDSRAIMSGEQGGRVYTLSRDHKPSNEEEKLRIITAGGKIYQSQLNNTNLLGPFRVQPGRLSVSRTFGDIEAKVAQYGGNSKVIICQPEIRQFKITPDHDFILLASDGIFDKLSSKDIISSCWDYVESQVKEIDMHQTCGLLVEKTMNDAIKKKTTDNITVVAIGLEGMNDYLMKNKENQNSKYSSFVSQSDPLKSPLEITNNLKKSTLQKQ